MAAEVVVHVRLNWSAPGHYDATQALPCIVCRRATHERTQNGEPCDKSCFEGELARELIGQASTRIVDERLATRSAYRPSRSYRRTWTPRLVTV